MEYQFHHLGSADRLLVLMARQRRRIVRLLPMSYLARTGGSTLRTEGL